MTDVGRWCSHLRDGKVKRRIKFGEQICSCIWSMFNLRCPWDAPMEETLESACLGLRREVRTRRVNLEISGMGIFILISSFSYLFIYFWLHWFFVAGHRFLQLRLVGATLHCDSRGFSFHWLLLLWSTSSRGSNCSLQARECQLTSGGTRA